MSEARRLRLAVPSPRTLIAVLSFVAVMSVAVVDFDRTAPGALHAAHARIDGLASESSCADCHGGWTSSMTASCLDCHETIQAHIDGHIGLHGVMDPSVAAQCAGCHSDHHGDSFQAVNDLSFARAGVADRLQFEHGLVGFAMDGAHLELDCAECHEHAEAVVVPEGGHRYIGLNQDCAACHEDVHEGTLTSACFVCHTQTRFDEHVFIGHGDFLPLVGPHGEVGCRECHAEGGDHSLEALRGPKAERPPARDCATCHGQPHDETFVENAARIAAISSPGALAGTGKNRLCVGCHEPEHMTFDEGAEELTALEHFASGFPLELPHDGLGCADCHDPALSFAERYPGRHADGCASCHEDVHGGQFAGRTFAAAADFAGGSVDERGCLTCHERTHFEPHTFGIDAHAGTALELTGAHLETSCEACHALADSGVRQFHGVSSRCDACHENVHGEAFVAALDERPEPRHGQCAHCHDPSSFRLEPGAPFDHLGWTGYELTGSHAAADCTSCHRRSDEPDAAGRTFGRVDEIYGTVTGCASCHDDVHAGRFDGDGLPSDVQGRTDCARCHSTASFRELPHGFDHRLWADWPLEDAHAEADCSSCHAPLRRPDALGRTWGHARGRDCASCHASPHGEQFAADQALGLSAKACESCHLSAESFRELAFDHDLESRFPLDEAHEAVSCGGCHEPVDELGGAVRYRPLSMECVDCHGVHEKALRKRKKRGG